MRVDQRVDAFRLQGAGERPEQHGGIDGAPAIDEQRALGAWQGDDIASRAAKNREAVDSFTVMSLARVVSRRARRLGAEAAWRSERRHTAEQEKRRLMSITGLRFHWP